MLLNKRIINMWYNVDLAFWDYAHYNNKSLVISPNYPSNLFLKSSFSFKLSPLVFKTYIIKNLKWIKREKLVFSHETFRLMISCLTKFLITYWRRNIYLWTKENYSRDRLTNIRIYKIARKTHTKICEKYGLVV